ncbi:unnamed protein product [Mucor hiemalis]
MEYTFKEPQVNNTEKNGPYERVLIVDDTTISKSQLTQGEEELNSSNLFSSSSSLSEEDINETEGEDYYSQLLAEAECVLQTEKTSGVSTPTPNPTGKLNCVPRFFTNLQWERMLNIYRTMVILIISVVYVKLAPPQKVPTTNI